MYNFSVTEDRKGEIQIDNFRERFTVDFSFWTKAEYEVHWHQASRVLEMRQAVSFIQSMHDPKSANFYRTWAAYSLGGEIIFQEQLLMLDELAKKFGIEQPHLNALPYEAVSENGEPLSKWRSQNTIVSR